MQIQPESKDYRLEIGVLSSPCFADTVNRLINMWGSSGKATGCQKKKKECFLSHRRTTSDIWRCLPVSVESEDYTQEGELAVAIWEQTLGTQKIKSHMWNGKDSHWIY